MAHNCDGPSLVHGAIITIQACEQGILSSRAPIKSGQTLKYLITGGAGFVGSHLADSLLAEGNSVTVLDDFSTGNRSNLAHHQGNPSLEIVEGSILDEALVDQLTSKSDRVFHLAAAVGVFNIVQKPLQSLRTNIKGSENVFEAALKYQKPVLITSSSEIYGKNTSDSLSEDDDRIVGAPQKIRWSYSDAKAIDEAMAITLHQQEGLETRIVRLFNTVGPRQVGNYGMVVPRFVLAALKNEPIQIYGTGHQTRCFGHVLDVVDAIIRVDRTDSLVGKPVNIGVENEISILALAELIKKLTNSQSQLEFKDYEKVYAKGFEDMERRVPNSSLLRERTDWKPSRDISTIILDICEYLKSSRLPRRI